MQSITHYTDINFINIQQVTEILIVKTLHKQMFYNIRV